MSLASIKRSKNIIKRNVNNKSIKKVDKLLLRYKIGNIRKSEFYLKNVQTPEPKGVNVGMDPIFIDEKILDMIF